MKHQKGQRRTLSILSMLSLSALLLGGSTRAQETLKVQLQNIQLQPVTISNMKLDVLRVNPALFQQTLAAPNVLKFNLNDLPARLQARDAEVSSSISLTSRLQGLQDVRADMARASLSLPRGLTVPASVQLRTGEQKLVLLYGQDTVAMNVANAEANAAKNRAEVLQSFGLNDQNPVPKEFLSQAQAPATTAASTTTIANTRTTNLSNVAIPAQKLPIEVRLPIINPSQPGQEQGDGGAANPTDGACRFTPTNALFNQMRGSNLNLITTIKDQASRGTCMSFAFTSALESLIARKKGTRFNLSEQYAYYWLRGDDGVLGDGAGWGDFDDTISKNRWIPTEVRWKYNPSRNRVRVPANHDLPITAFQNSCVSYSGQACSDTTAQAQLVCQAGTNNCAWKPEFGTVPGTQYNFRPTKGNEVWGSLGGLPFSDPNVTRAYRRAMLRKMLDRGDQLVLGFSVDRAFDSIGANGQPNTALMGQNYRGGHAVHIVGYINQGTQTFNNVRLAGLINLGSMTFPTGAWVIKNSWSCGFGDGGYAYLPDNFLDTETWGVYNLPNGAVASDMPGF